MSLNHSNYFLEHFSFAPNWKKPGNRYKNFDKNCEFILILFDNLQAFTTLREKLIRNLAFLVYNDQKIAKKSGHHKLRA